MKVTINEKERYIDGLLQKNIDLCKENIKKDWDYLFVVDGEVGSGKSVFTQQIADYASDGKLGLNQVCFNPKQFKEAILKAPKYSSVIFDEAFRGLSSRAALTQTNKIVVSMLQEIRQKNLFVFIVLPSIWDLDKYVSLHRCKGLFHVYTDVRKNRGFFRFYKRDKLTMMFGNPMKWRYKYPHAPQIKGRFTKFYPLGEQEYRDKKAKSLGDYGYQQDTMSKRETKKQEQLSTLLKFCNEHLGLSQEKLGTILGLSHQAINSKINLTNPLENEHYSSKLDDKEVLT